MSIFDDIIDEVLA